MCFCNGLPPLSAKLRHAPALYKGVRIPKFAAAAALTAGRVVSFLPLTGRIDAIRVEPWSYDFVLLHPVPGWGFLFLFKGRLACRLCGDRQTEPNI